MRGIKYMRIIVMFDLPVKTKLDRKKYSQFRNYLLINGFYKIQFSVYGKLCVNYDEANVKINSLAKVIPKKGDVRCLQITEKQYQGMRVFLNKISLQEKSVNLKTLVLL
jgi:CRISPR-associated protein Cas2